MSTLSFQPKFHHEIEHDGKKMWTVTMPSYGLPFNYCKEIGDEQKKIKDEGGVIFFFDPKFNSESNLALFR